MEEEPVKSRETILEAGKQDETRPL